MIRTVRACGRIFSRLLVFCVVSGAGLSTAGVAQSPQPKPGDPTTPKARKSFAEGLDWEKHGQTASAVDSFLSANKQDGGTCTSCLNRAFTLAFKSADYKGAETALRAWLPLAKSDADRATLHLRLGTVLQQEGIGKKKDRCFNESCDEFKTGLQLDPTLVSAYYEMGISLAYLHQDDAARAEFIRFLGEDKHTPMFHERAQRFADRIELARAKMAPAFQITTIDGQHVTIESLQGKVVLIDFWATWCGPCREALPHMQALVKKFAGQPLVALSISLDSDESKWKAFVAKNGMTWMQARDGGFTGPMSTLFAVNAIPATFSIDADGVIEDQHVGDADIDGKLKKLIARANEVAVRKQAASAGEAGQAGVH